MCDLFRGIRETECVTISKNVSQLIKRMTICGKFVIFMIKIWGLKNFQDFLITNPHENGSRDLIGLVGYFSR